MVKSPIGMDNWNKDFKNQIKILFFLIFLSWELNIRKKNTALKHIKKLYKEGKRVSHFSLKTTHSRKCESRRNLDLFLRFFYA